MPKFASQININDEYTLPTSAGSTGQVLTLDGTDAKWAPLPTGSSGTVSGTGTNHTVAMWDGTTDIEDSQIYQGNSGYVGMQKAIPTAPLHVYNNENGKSTQLTLENGDTSLSTGQVMAGIVFQSNDSSTNASGSAGKISSVAETTSGAFAMTFDTKNGTDLGERMRIDPDGKVGIGTDSPSEKLHVHNGEAIVGSSTDGVKLSYSNGNSSGIIDTAFSDNNLEFRTNGDSKMFITNGGNVGIGTTSPKDRLDLYDADDNVGIYFHTATSGIGGGDGLRVGQNNANAFVWNYEATPLTLATSGIARLTILDGGNVGIGTDNPSAMLDIEGMSATVPAMKVNAGSGDNMILDMYNSSNVKRMGFEYDNSNINFNIVDRNTNKLFTVREGGNVGIGDDTPTYKLDVDGAIRATGDITATSDVRTKENIKTIENASDKVSKLRGVSFNKIGDDANNIGVIAQEVEKIIPEVVHTDNQGMKSVAYANLVGLLIESNKELIESNKELQKRIEILESK